jgi:ribosomal protein L40E
MANNMKYHKAFLSMLLLFSIVGLVQAAVLANRTQDYSYSTRTYLATSSVPTQYTVTTTSYTWSGGAQKGVFQFSCPANPCELAYLAKQYLNVGSVISFNFIVVPNVAPNQTVGQITYQVWSPTAFVVWQKTSSDTIIQDSITVTPQISYGNDLEFRIGMSHFSRVLAVSLRVFVGSATTVAITSYYPRIYYMTQVYSYYVTPKVTSSTSPNSVQIPLALSTGMEIIVVGIVAAALAGLGVFFARSRKSNQTHTRMEPIATGSFCINCGANLPSDSDFCNKCGAKVQRTGG